MDLGISGRVALVGAASRGIGRAAARALGGAGCKVGICARGRDDLLAVAGELEGEGVDCLAVEADLGDSDEVRRVVREVEGGLGPVDILVNNTGGPPPGTFDDFGEDAWYGAFEGLFMSSVRLYGLVLPGMRERRWGRIVNVSSLSILQPIDNLILSNAIRLGVQGLAKSVSAEVAADGVTVNSVCPGFTHTPRVGAMAGRIADAEGIAPEEAMARFAAPVGRVADPQEVAATIAFLASDAAAFITGAAVPVAGGSVRAAI